MEKSEKKSFMTRIQDYLDSPKGRVLLNYLYSWGAAIVILGGLFKLTHIKGANLMLFIGMGTEVFVFFISGFERPFIPPRQEEEEEESPALQGKITTGRATGSLPTGQTMYAGQAAPAGQAIYTGQAAPAGKAFPTAPAELPAVDAEALPQKHDTPPSEIGSVSEVTQEYINRIYELTARMEQICRHSEKMEQNSEELEQLSRNLISINTFYQMHLKSASSQMENIDKVNEQTKHMVEQIEELNRVYARMVEALKVNTPMGSKID